jgi:hypothetical protein
MHLAELKRYLKKHSLDKRQKAMVRAHLKRDMQHFKMEIKEDEDLLKELDE